MYNVHFAKGSALAYAALTTKDPGTLYFITDAETPAFYLGSQKLSSLAEVAAIAARCDGEDTEIGIIKDALYGIDISKRGEVKSVIDTITDAIKADIGTVTNLTTTNKTVVTAINEINEAVEQNLSDTIITVVTTENANGLLKRYTIKQGTDVVGNIDIPKDLVVKSGKLVTLVQDENNPTIYNVQGSATGETVTSADVTKTGTYIELKINNQEVDTPIYINVTDLIDIYTAQQNATQIQLAVVGNVISATVVAQSITSAELATDSVITTKIADLNVTKQKLETSVQNSLDKADSAVQTIAEGTQNYGFLVDGTFVKVHGLGSAALKDDDYFDLKNSAANVLGTSTDTYEVATVYGVRARADKMYTDATVYTDNALTWGAMTEPAAEEPEP